MDIRSIGWSNRIRRIAATSAAVVAGAALALSQHAPAQAHTLPKTDPKTYPKATVHADGGLIAHRAPSTHAPHSYVFDDGDRVSIDCRSVGTNVEGNFNWYLVSAEGDAKWVSGRYLHLEGRPEFCGGDLTVPAVTTASTGAYEGPTKHDLYDESLNKGVGVEVYCYTDSAPVGQQSQRWALAGEIGWIPASDLKTAKNIPYCQQV